MKKILYIFIFTFLVVSGTLAQTKSTVASSDPAVKFMHFYPNPAITAINFEFQKGFDQFFSFQVYNFIGKKVFDVKTVTPKINISLTDFYRGVYIYQLRDRGGRIIDSGKFQVIK